MPTIKKSELKTYDIQGWMAKIREVMPAVKRVKVDRERMEKARKQFNKTWKNYEREK